MTHDEAEKLARKIEDAIGAWESDETKRKVRRFIRSYSHEIENAAFERAIMAVRAIRLNPPYTAAIVRDSACDAIRALIQPPAQKETGE